MAIHGQRQHTHPLQQFLIAHERGPLAIELTAEDAAQQAQATFLSIAKL